MTALWKYSCFWLSMTSALLLADAFAGIQPSTRLQYQPQQHDEQHHTQPKTTTALSLSSTTTTTTTNTNDSLLQPAYEIERIPIRIGHGFDIHRMAPLEEAGQPLIIGGVHVTHKDQKVRRELERMRPRDVHTTQSAFMYFLGYIEQM
jgi:hypothetical protein